MDMLATALPPIQPHVSAKDAAHPRFGEYRAYRASMSALLVTACSFDSWLRQTEERERPAEIVFKVDWKGKPQRERPDEALEDGWYKHQFAPGHKLIARLGPFETEAEAQAS